MSQNYATIASTTPLSSSLQPLLDRDDAAASCFSGSAFPSTNLLLGMLCYRTDQLKLYQLTNLTGPVWTLVYDLSSGSVTAPVAASAPWSGVTGKPTTVAGYGITDAMKKTGDSATGKINFVASAAGAASIALPHGVAPSAPVDGDVWSTTGGFAVRVAGSTFTLSMLQAAESYTAKKTFPAGSASFASLNVPAGTAPTTPVNGDLWASTTQLTYRMNGVSRNVAFWDGNSRIPLANGGTGAGDAAGARAAIEAAKLGVLTGVIWRYGDITFAFGDQGKLQVFNGTSATFYIPPDSTTFFEDGTYFNVINLGSGNFYVQPGAGVNLYTNSNNRRLTQWGSAASIVKVGANAWVMAGDLSA